MKRKIVLLLTAMVLMLSLAGCRSIRTCEVPECNYEATHSGFCAEHFMEYIFLG